MIKRLFFLFFAFPFFAHASNLEREMRLTQEVLSGFIDGEAVFLTTINNIKFLALHTRSDEKSKGIVIMLHGRGFHSNWHNVTQPVRSLLPEAGWDTLSLQMPVLDKDAEVDDYTFILPDSPPRIEAAIHFVKKMGYKTIVLLSHNCGGQMMLHWLDQQKKPTTKISALVNISLGIDTYLRANDRYPSFENTNIPILDIFGSQGILTGNTTLRKAQIERSGDSRSQQIEIAGAEDQFIDQGEILTAAIKTWLDSLSISR